MPDQEYEPDPDESPVLPEPDRDDPPEDGVPADGDLDDITDGTEEGERPRKYYVDDVAVTVLNERVQYYTPEGGLVTESLTDYTRKNVRDEYATLDDFLQRWSRADRKQAVIDELEERGVFIEELRQEVGTELDPFDLICHIAFDEEPLTRSERARQVRQSDYFDAYVWKVPVEEIEDRDYNLDIDNPHEEDEAITDPDELLARYEVLQEEIAETRQSLKDELESALQQTLA